MKKAYILILIAAFAFPAFGQAASTPVVKTVAQTTPTTPVETTDINSPILQGKSLSAKKVIVQAALDDIYSQLVNLSTQTQTAINQLNSNAVPTADAQTALLGATTSLSKAKIDIAAFSAITVSNTRFSSFTLDLMKNTAGTAEISLRDAKTHLLDSLASLKASLPTLDTTN